MDEDEIVAWDQGEDGTYMIEWRNGTITIGPIIPLIEQELRWLGFAVDEGYLEEDEE